MLPSGRSVQPVAGGSIRTAVAPAGTRPGVGRYRSDPSPYNRLKKRLGVCSTEELRSTGLRTYTDSCARILVASHRTGHVSWSDTFRFSKAGQRWVHQDSRLDGC